MKAIPIAAVLALSTVSTAQSSSAECVPEFDSRAAELVRSARASAAERLEDAVEQIDGEVDGQPLALLQVALRAAAASLGTASSFGDRLRVLAFEDDLDRLDRDVERAISDLRFRPMSESPMPVGFPDTAPVGEAVLKSYPLYRMAATSMRGESTAFWKLFNHIKEADIAMTAPVQMDEREMAFLYREPEMGSAGEDGAVEVVDVEPHLAVSIGVRGYASPQAVTRVTAELEAWLELRSDVLVADGLPRTMGHNSPMVPPSRRFWEVEIPVRRVEAPQQTAAR